MIGAVCMGDQMARDDHSECRKAVESLRAQLQAAIAAEEVRMLELTKRLQVTERRFTNIMTALDNLLEMGEVDAARLAIRDWLSDPNGTPVGQLN